MNPAPAPEPGGDKRPAALSLQDQRKEARDQLSLVLNFFSRVDAKASALLAIDTGMLALLTSKAPALATMPVLSRFLAGVTVGMLGVSLWFLYRVAFPYLDGGHHSRIYFREIAQRTETDFIDTFRAEEEELRVKDLLAQVWRNSCILKAKFDALKWAFILMALAIFPWALTVAMFSSQAQSIATVITK